MAKKQAKQVKEVVVAEDFQKIIDRGLDVDTSIKNLTYEDSGIKHKLQDVAVENISDGEKSVVLIGTRAKASVVVVEKSTLNNDAPSFAEAQTAIRIGTLRDIVTRVLTLSIAQEKIALAKDILMQNGIDVEIEEALTISKPELKKSMENISSFSEVKKNAVLALNNSMKIETSYRVTFDKIDKDSSEGK